MDTATEQPTVRATLERMDDAWKAFHDRVIAIPSELLEARLGEDSWTRKQMLAHIATWHDLTVDRLAEFAESGTPSTLDEHEDVINARAARGAEGRTNGEVLLTTDDSYRRLRREVGRLSNAQLAAHDGWASAVIAGNTYEHYAEHRADLEPKPRS